MGVAVRVSTSTFSFSFLIFSLCVHAETLLLVNDQKPQILELQIVDENPVGTDDNIHQPPLCRSSMVFFC